MRIGNIKNRILRRSLILLTVWPILCVVMILILVVLISEFLECIYRKIMQHLDPILESIIKGWNA